MNDPSETLLKVPTDQPGPPATPQPCDLLGSLRLELLVAGGEIALDRVLRAVLEFFKAGVRFGSFRTALRAAGLPLDGLATLVKTPAQLAALAKDIIESGQIPPDDPIFNDIDFDAK